MVINPRGSKPGSTALTRRKLSIISPAAIVRTRAIEISETTKALVDAAQALRSDRRVIQGVSTRSLVLALPGSPRGVADSLDAVLEAIPHGLRTLRNQVSDAPAAHRPS